MIKNTHMHLPATSTLSVVAYVFVSITRMQRAGVRRMVG